MPSSIRQALIILGTIAAWVLCSIAQLEKYFSPHKALLLLFAGAATIALGLSLLSRLLRRAHDLGWAWLGGLYLVLVVLFLVVYPLAQKRSAGPGSDREDALRVEIVAVDHGQYPYDARTFQNHRPSPLPGAALLASPFFAIGRIALQNLFWAAAFFILLTYFFRRRATAICYLCIFLLFAAQNLDDWVVGGDYITNLLYVAVAVSLCVVACTKAWYYALAAGLLLGIALSSRIFYAPVVLPLLALVLQRAGKGRALLQLSAILAAGAAVTIPVFMPHPVPRLAMQLGQNSDKLAGFPPFLHPSISLPLIALAICATAFAIKMDLARLFLLFGLGSLVMIGCAMATLVHSQGGWLSGHITPDLCYLAPPLLFISLWMFSIYEKESMRAIGSGNADAAA